MSIWSWLRGGGHDGSAAHRAAMADEPRHNPATGLPMMGGIGGIDTLGNSYGMTSRLDHDSWTSTSSTLSHDAFRSSFDPNRGWCGALGRVFPACLPPNYGRVSGRTFIRHRS